MRNIKSLIYLLFFAVFIIQACSVDKRRYTSGYAVKWNKNEPSVKSKNQKVFLTQKKETSIKSKVKIISYEEILSLKDVKTLTASIEKRKAIILLAPDSVNCDTLIMRNGTEIKAKVTEITPTEIKFKYCNNLSGPNYVVYRYEVSYVKYANGSLDSFVDEFKPAPAINKYNKRDKDQGSYTENYVSKRCVAANFFGAFSLIPFYGFPAGIIAIIMGMKCLHLIDKDPKTLLPYRHRTMVGIVLGAIGIAITILIFGAILVAAHII